MTAAKREEYNCALELAVAFSTQVTIHLTKFYFGQLTRGW